MINREQAQASDLVRGDFSRGSLAPTDQLAISLGDRHPHANHLPPDRQRRRWLNPAHNCPIAASLMHRARRLASRCLRACSHAADPLWSCLVTHAMRSAVRYRLQGQLGSVTLPAALGPISEGAVQRRLTYLHACRRLADRQPAIDQHLRAHDLLRCHGNRPSAPAPPCGCRL